MSESTKIILEWTYSPKDFFEGRIELTTEQYQLVLDDGKGTATMDASVYDSDPSIRQRLNQELEDRFLGAQLVSRRPYELSKSVLLRIHPNGRRHIVLGPVSAHAVSSTSTADIIVLDAEGNIIADSRRERLKRRERFSELAAKYRGLDATVDRILLSFDASIRDSDNELVHLYEIRDALSRKFAGESAVCGELGIESSHWKRLGQLANAEPVKQGRHRGHHLGILRDATSAELDDARNVAVRMIEAYFGYLERNT